FYRWPSPRTLPRSTLSRSARMNLRAFALAATVLAPAALAAQTAADHIVLGDKDHAAMNAAGALQHYQEAIAMDPNNAEALWRANIMRLSGFTRFMAKNLLGGKTFDEANWKDAAGLLERAVMIDPDRIVHRLDLAGVYRDRGETAKARAEYQTALRLKPQEYD